MYAIIRMVEEEQKYVRTTLSADPQVVRTKIFLKKFKKGVDIFAGICYYIVTEREKPTRRKERKKMTDYIETSMEALIEEALAEMEAKGETLPEIRYNEEA